MTLSRFARYLRRDDDAKEYLLREVADGVSERVALERTNARCNTSHTEGDLRTWLREDREFAKALRVARRADRSEPHVWDLRNL